VSPGVVRREARRSEMQVMFAVRMRLGRFSYGLGRGQHGLVSKICACARAQSPRASSPLVRGSRKCNSAMRDIEKRRRVVADDSHHRGRGHLNQRSARPRSPHAQQQVKHVHLLMVIRPVVQQAEQQRQLEFVLPSNRGRSGVVVEPSRRGCDLTLEQC
jgi:hypothetical protein